MRLILWALAMVSHLAAESRLIAGRFETKLIPSPLACLSQFGEGAAGKSLRIS